MSMIKKSNTVSVDTIVAFIGLILGAVGALIFAFGITPGLVWMSGLGYVFGWAYTMLLLSNVCWIFYSLRLSQSILFCMNAVYLLINLLGVWACWLRPLMEM